MEENDPAHLALIEELTDISFSHDDPTGTDPYRAIEDTLTLIARSAVRHRVAENHKTANALEDALVALGQVFNDLHDQIDHETTT